MRKPVEHVHINARGETLRILGWPTEGAKAALFFHHGFGEHVGRYQTFADQMPNVSVWGYDCRGHGEHTQKQGHADGLDQLADDLHAMLPVLMELSGAEQFVLGGHSMGAGVVLQYLTDHPPHAAIRGVILAASPVVVELDLAQRIKVMTGRWLAKVVPALTLASGINHEGISSVPEEVQRYRRDPLVDDSISLALARSLVDDAPKLVERAHAIDLPVLLLHGDQDPIARVAGSEALAQRIPNQRFVRFASARHEMHHETTDVVEGYFDAITTFVDELHG